MSWNMTGYMIVCRNKSSILIDKIELRIRLNQFEIFVSSWIHENNMKNCSVIEKKSVKSKPCKYKK